VATIRSRTVLRLLISINVGLLCSAGVLTVGRAVDPDAVGGPFFLGDTVTNLLGDWLGWDPQERADDLTGLMVQHVIYSGVIALLCFWALSRFRGEEDKVRRVAWLMAASTPWLTLAVMAELPRSLLDAAMKYCWMILCLGISLRGVWLAKESWPRLKVEAVLALVVGVGAWLFAVGFAGPVERFVVITSGLAAAGLASSAIAGSPQRQLPDTPARE
jgi:hypothetical protein